MFKIHYNLEENILINSPIKTVWENVVFFANSQKWSPWLILDTNCKSKITWEDWTLSAKYSWDWEFVWAWEQFHTEIVEYSEIKSKVVFLKPFKNIWEVYFKFEEIDWKTKVTWWMNSSVPFFIFFLKNMISKMISRDYRRWLKMLKWLCEKWGLNTKSDLEKNVLVDSFYWFWIKNNANTENIWEKMHSDITKLFEIAKEKDIKMINMLSFSTQKSDVMNWFFEYIVSFKVSKEDFDKIEENWDLEKGYFDWSNSIKVTHTWSYDYLENSWTLWMSSLRTLKLKKNKKLNPFEVYLNDPNSVEEKDLKTDIYIPIK